MRPILLDTNAVLRYMLADIPEQADQTAGAIASGAEITIEVLAECVYVLCGHYATPREAVAAALRKVLGEVECSRKDSAAEALRLFAGCRLDFVDCMLIAESTVNGREILTFDRKMRNRLV